MWKKVLSITLISTLVSTISAFIGVISMANKYCNLQGTQKISESYNNINIGFDRVEEDLNNVNKRINDIITTPAGSVSAQEIIDARDGMPTLGEKIRGIETQINTLNNSKAEKTEVVSFLSESKAYTDTKVTAVASGSPRGVYATLSALQSAYPNGTTGIFVVAEDGKWYYWNGNAWTAGGIYQATAIADGSVSRDKLTDSFMLNGSLTAGTDLNTVLKEGNYYGNPAGSFINVPEDLDSNTGFLLHVEKLTDRWYKQTLSSLDDFSYTWTRRVDAISTGHTPWRKYSDAVYRFPYLTSDDDLNDYCTDGRWVAVNPQNAPYSSGNYLFEVKTFKTNNSLQNWVWGIQSLCCLSSELEELRFFVRGFYLRDNGTILWTPWTRLDNEYPSANNTLYGKTIVNFGDSIFGNFNDSTSISSYLASLSGATVYNVGFGGCRMSQHSMYWDAFSMYRLAEAIANNDFNYQDEAIANYSGFPSYFSSHLETLKNIDFSKVDYITIAYGTNDYTAGIEIENPDDPEDVTTYKGALRYSLRLICEAYPNLKILVCTPMYRFWSNEDGSFKEDSDTKTFNSHGDTLPEFVEATKEVAKEFKMPYLDNYFELGINKYNRLEYFTTTDGTHPQASGRKRVAERIYNALSEF